MEDKNTSFIELTRTLPGALCINCHLDVKTESLSVFSCVLNIFYVLIIEGESNSTVGEATSRQRTKT